MRARVAELELSTIKVTEELGHLLSVSISMKDNDAFRVAKCAWALGRLLDVAILDKTGKIIWLWVLNQWTESARR